MKTVFKCLIATTIFSFNLLAQLGHIAPCSGSGSHSTANCYGYAIGKAGGKNAGDGTCNPATLFLDRSYLFQGTYFVTTNASNVSLSGLANNDVVIFDDHAAFVTNADLNTPVNSTVSHIYRDTVRSNTVYQVTQSPYNYIIQGYVTRKQISVNVINNFGGGLVKVGGADPDAGGPHYINWWGTVPIEVVDFQTIRGHKRRFKVWDANTSEAVYTGTISYPVRGGPYTAICDSLLEITFNNSLPGTTGGVIKVNDTIRTAQFVGYTAQKTPAEKITGGGCYQVIDKIEYNFSYWSPGGSTDSSTDFYPTSNASFTAHFTTKPLAPTNLQQRASIGQNVHLTWEDNSNTSRVTKYNIYRAAPSIPEQKHLVDTVAAGVQSWYDSDVIVKGPRDGPEYVYYVCGVDNQTLSEGYEATVNQFGQPVSARIGAQLASEEGAVLPTQFSVGNYPNPFNPSTTIAFSLVQNSTVKLDIYDVMGRKVRSLVDGNKSAGYYSIVWNGKDESGREVASGMYLYRFAASPVTGEKAFTQSGKLLLTK